MKKVFTFLITDFNLSMEQDQSLLETKLLSDESKHVYRGKKGVDYNIILTPKVKYTHVIQACMSSSPIATFMYHALMSRI
mmetsp:Transcript_38999/g.81632  ORF Transcript_38999/g.81632 Transcript_38999/m.81632 type:complete len:80 (+) Transcript_38999:811-1050(+)